MNRYICICLYNVDIGLENTAHVIQHLYDKLIFEMPEFLPNLAMNTTLALFWEQMFKITRRKPGLKEKYHFFETLPVDSAHGTDHPISLIPN